jgi:excinuclease ABC subunit B
MYAANVTKSMKLAIDETNRRRKVQAEYNKVHGITPQSINKAIRDVIESEKKAEVSDMEKIDVNKIPADELSRIIKDIDRKMKFAAENLQFEKAAEYRDMITEIREQKEKLAFNKKIK